MDTFGTKNNKKEQNKHNQKYNLKNLLLYDDSNNKINKHILKIEKKIYLFKID